MIFEALNENVMLVEMSGDELKKYSVTYDTLNCNDAKTRAVVRKVLSEADILRGETCEKITVEALPTNDGGCFFIVTFREKAKPRYRVKTSAERLMLETDGIDEILDFANAMKNEKSLRGKCPIFRYKKKYFLCADAPSVKTLRVMGEFGTIHRANEICIKRLSEHGEYMGKI